MDLRVLNYFLAVAQEKNISNASERLHVSQPTISRQLKDLEEELGTKLFTRGNREITLTKDGEYLLNQARQILTLANKTVNNLHQSHEIEGSLFIGGAETQNMRSIGRAVTQLHDKYPKIITNIISENADEVHKQIDSGLLDFGIVLDPSNNGDYNFLKLPGQATWGLIMPKSSKLATQKAIKPEDLKNICLIISQQGGVTGDLEKWLGHNLDDYNIVATYNLLTNAIVLVRSGLGYAFCIDGVVNLNGTNLTFVPLSPAQTAGVSLIWSKKSPMSDPAVEFLKQIKSSIQFMK
ncbi:LysR family transcriptional regulator [Companilactobacillus sp.]|uniref:LysR family transcriptional regulator n=1 Tax=Companilactobacillus sp. TaxID=2767905 RepID=UPI002621C6F7|nr:LysR family transcriptional regulator [Companilactobacillus sp.]